jgi:putative peptidoglycan lipid II flippase
MSASKSLNNQQIIRAALVVLVGFLASGVLGIVRNAIISAQFGTSSTIEAFLAAQRIPETIFVLVAGGALGSSFIPVYARIRAENEQQAWKLASTVTSLAALAAGVLGLIVIFAAPWLVSTVLLSESSAEIQALTIDMMRLMMVTPFIFSISGLVMGLLQSHGLFLLPSLAISMNHIGIMIGALLLAPNLPAAEGLAQVGEYNVYGLAYGAVLSALLHLLVQVPGLLQIRAQLRPSFNWKMPGVMEVLRLMGPRVLGLGITQVNFIVNIILTDRMIEGSFAAVNYAFTLLLFALGIIAQSVGSAVFPTLSALVAENDMVGYKNRLAQAMRSVLFLAIPSTVALMLMGQPLISVLYERGHWTPEGTAATAWALAFYASGIVGFALLEVLSRAFYALADTWTPVKIGIGAMVSNIVLSILFMQMIGDPDSLARGPFAGLALANALTTLIEAALLWWLLRRRIGDINDRYILSAAAKATFAALVMGGALLLVLNANLNALLTLILGGGIGALVFFGLSLALGLEEARAVPQMLLRRFRR